MSLQTIIKWCALCALLLLAGCGIPNATVKNGTGQDVMLLGHDPVAYFTQQQSIRGNPVFQTSLTTGVAARTYYFLNAKNKQIFDAAPAQYEPQFAGFCAQGMANGLKLAADPSEWRVHNGKLYVFANALARAGWDLDPQQHAANSQRLWPDAKDAGWRSQTVYRSIIRVSGYQSDTKLRKALWDKDPSNPVAQFDTGSLWHSLTAKEPGQRAREGYGTRPMIGLVGDDPCPVACIGTVTKAFGDN